MDNKSKICCSINAFFQNEKLSFEILGDPSTIIKEIKVSFFHIFF